MSALAEYQSSTLSSPLTALGRKATYRNSNLFGNNALIGLPARKPGSQIALSSSLQLPCARILFTSAVVEYPDTKGSANALPPQVCMSAVSGNTAMS